MKVLKIAILSLLVAPIFVSCGDDNDYVPGTQVAADCPDVYFTNANSNNQIFTPVDVPSVINIELKRANASGALTVPITATLDAILSAPSEVTFEDGSTTATYPISINGTVESGVTYTYSLSIPEEYVDFYEVKDGAGKFSGQFVLAGEVTFSVYVQDQSSGYKNLFPAFNQSAYEVSSTSYVFPDFLGSGHTVKVLTGSDGQLLVTGEDNYSYNYASSSCIWLNGPMYCGTTPGADDLMLYGAYVYYGSYSAWSAGLSWWTDSPGFYLNCQFYYTTPTKWASDSYTGYDWGYIYFYINN